METWYWDDIKKTYMWSIDEYQRANPEHITSLMIPNDIKQTMFLQAILMELRRLNNQPKPYQ